MSMLNFLGQNYFYENISFVIDFNGGFRYGAYSKCKKKDVANICNIIYHIHYIYNMYVSIHLFLFFSSLRSTYIDNI